MKSIIQIKIERKRPALDCMINKKEVDTCPLCFSISMINRSLTFHWLLYVMHARVVCTSICIGWSLDFLGVDHLIITKLTSDTVISQKGKAHLQI